MSSMRASQRIRRCGRILELRRMPQRRSRAVYAAVVLAGGTVFANGAQSPFAVAQQLQHVLMIFLDRLVVADADECRARGAEQLIEPLLISRVQGAGRFVQHGVPGL